eukprot:gene18052-27810_t
MAQLPAGEFIDAGPATRYYRVCDAKSTYWILAGKGLSDLDFVWRVKRDKDRREFYCNAATRQKVWRLPAFEEQRDDVETEPPMGEDAYRQSPGTAARHRGQPRAPLPEQQEDGVSTLSQADSSVGAVPRRMDECPHGRGANQARGSQAAPAQLDCSGHSCPQHPPCARNCRNNRQCSCPTSPGLPGGPHCKHAEGRSCAPPSPCPCSPLVPCSSHAHSSNEASTHLVTCPRSLVDERNAYQHDGQGPGSVQSCALHHRNVLCCLGLRGQCRHGSLCPLPHHDDGSSPCEAGDRCAWHPRRRPPQLTTPPAVPAANPLVPQVAARLLCCLGLRGLCPFASQACAYAHVDDQSTPCDKGATCPFGHWKPSSLVHQQRLLADLQRHLGQPAAQRPAAPPLAGLQRRLNSFPLGSSDGAGPGYDSVCMSINSTLTCPRNPSETLSPRALNNVSGAGEGPIGCLTDAQHAHLMRLQKGHIQRPGQSGAAVCRDDAHGPAFAAPLPKEACVQLSLSQARGTIQFLWAELAKAAQEVDRTRGDKERAERENALLSREIHEVCLEKDRYRLQVQTVAADVTRLTEALDDTIDGRVRQHPMHPCPSNPNQHPPCQMPRSSRQDLPLSGGSPMGDFPSSSHWSASDAPVTARSFTDVTDHGRAMAAGGMVPPAPTTDNGPASCNGPSADAASALSKCTTPTPPEWRPAAAPAFTRGLLVGVGYKGLGHAGRFTAVDEVGREAGSFAALSTDALARMEQHLGPAGGRFEVLTDAAPAMQAPTKRNVLCAVERLVSSARAGDRLLLYLRGHGIVVDGVAGFLPVDCGTAGLLRGDTILRALARLPGGVEVLVVSDVPLAACIFGLKHVIAARSDGSPQWKPLNLSCYPMAASVKVVGVHTPAASSPVLPQLHKSSASSSALSLPGSCAIDPAKTEHSLTTYLIESLDRHPAASYLQVVADVFQSLNAVDPLAPIVHPYVGSNKPFDPADAFPRIGFTGSCAAASSAGLSQASSEAAPVARFAPRELAGRSPRAHVPTVAPSPPHSPAAEAERLASGAAGTYHRNNTVPTTTTTTNEAARAHFPPTETEWLPSGATGTYHSSNTMPTTTNEAARADSAFRTEAPHQQQQQQQERLLSFNFLHPGNSKHFAAGGAGPLGAGSVAALVKDRKPGADGQLGGGLLKILGGRLQASGGVTGLARLVELSRKAGRQQTARGPATPPPPPAAARGAPQELASPGEHRNGHRGGAARSPPPAGLRTREAAAAAAAAPPSPARPLRGAPAAAEPGFSFRNAALHASPFQNLSLASGPSQ